MDIIVRTPAEIQRRLEIGDYFIREVLERGQVLYAPDLPNPDPFPETAPSPPAQSPPAPADES